MPQIQICKKNPNYFNLKFQHFQHILLFDQFLYLLANGQGGGFEICRCWGKGSRAGSPERGAGSLQPNRRAAAKTRLKAWARHLAGRRVQRPLPGEERRPGDHAGAEVDERRPEQVEVLPRRTAGPGQF